MRYFCFDVLTSFLSRIKLMKQIETHISHIEGYFLIFDNCMCWDIRYVDIQGNSCVKKEQKSKNE